MSRHAAAIRLADSLGWRVLDDGMVLSPSGTPRRAYIPRNKRYGMITFRSGGDWERFYVHKLAAFQRFGEAALVPDVHVRHLDGDSLNNSRSNLALGSHTDNMLDRAPARRRRIALQAASSRRALSPEQVRELVALSAGMTGTALATRFNVRKSTVSEILSGKIYSEVTGITQRPRTRTEVPAHLREVA